MIDLIALALAIFLLLQLTRVRALLSFVFAKTRMRRIAVPRLPEAFADLHAEAANELRALGFEGPVWYLLDSPDSSVLAQPVAAWFQREHGDVVWLNGPAPPVFANRLVSVFVRRLADGRHCLSQAFDCYAEILANPQVLAQTIGGEDFAAQWQRHRDFCVRNGAAADGATDAAELDFQATDLRQHCTDSLVERGKVYRDTKGLLRPTLAFAWQLYAAIRRQPKPPASKQPIPPARLAWLAQVQQRQTQRPVPRRVQAGLFAFSVALFLLLGGWFWGLRFSVILFVVVGIHEFGHYLAMRLSGYRNVQMLALPLVGGVTIGHEAKPDAARRAWMSLMGPLPGIVIGWVLLGFWVFGGMAGSGLLFEAALVFLSLNYLNVLPVPPLDGAHVVQELLPVGSARLSAVFIAIASVVGALLAFWFGFKLLAFIALLQLPLVRTRWQLGGVLRILRGDPQMQSSQPAMHRQHRVFEVFDRVVGTTADATTRLALGTEAMRSIDVKPMRPLQRLFVGGTYAMLLAGPVFFGVVAIGFGSLTGFALNTAADAERYQQRAAQFEAQAAKLGIAEQLRGLAGFEAKVRDANATAAALATPADAAAIAAAQTRLGATLPDDLLAIYRVSNGFAALSLLPLDRVRRVSETTDLDLASFAYEGSITVYDIDAVSTDDEAPRDRSLTPQQMQSFLVLANDPDGASTLLYDLGEPPQHPGVRLYSLDNEGGGHARADLRRWLRASWVEWAQMAETGEHMNAARERERAAVADWPVERLLGDIERPGFLERRLAPQAAWSGAASEADMAGVAARFGAPMPDDLAVVYRQHDGIPTLALLPLAHWQTVSALPEDMAATLRKQVELSETGIEAAALDRCVVFSGYYFDPEAMAIELPQDVLAEMPAGLRSVSALWCPQAAADRRVVDIAHGTLRRGYTEILRERVVQQRAARSALD
jgi:Zn-dependent protease/cell wall assembly regulator SMI1